VALLSNTDLAELVDPRPSASEMISRRELLDRMRDALRMEERQIADLRGDGLSWDEVALKLGGTGQARRVQLSRGIERAVKELRLDD
jgi:RNA polymerase sigma-70 factor (ECF subfamily)